MWNTPERVKNGVKIYVSRGTIRFGGCVSCETKTLKNGQKHPKTPHFGHFLHDFPAGKSYEK